MAILMPFVLTSCSNDEFADYKKDGNLKSFTSFTATLDDVAGTRAYLDAEASDGIRRVHWEQGDVVSVYSDINPTLKKFMLTGIDENGVGTFTGEKITGNYFYAVFAPGKEITVDASDPDVVHLKGAVFNKNMMADQGAVATFAAPMVAATTGSSLSFKQTTGLVKITVGNVHQVDDLFFRGSKLEPIGEDYLVDMSEDKPVLKLDEGANIVSHDQIITDLDDKFVDVYFPLPPMVFENGFLLTITGVDAQGKEFEIDKSYNTCFEVKAGSISSFSLVDISAELEAQGSDEIIAFADPVVKQICVENWDTNGDGELSTNEAASVTDIPKIWIETDQVSTSYSIFAGKDGIGEDVKDILSFNELQYFTSSLKDILSFNELQYFTSLMEIPAYMFYGQKNLSEVTLPKGLNSIGNEAFYNCSSLSSIEIPEGVTSIGWDAFSGCSSLTSIVIPEAVTSIGGSAFYGCSSLTSIEIPKGVTRIGGRAFDGCNNLSSIVIPNSVTSIDSYAFRSCNSLASIEIPEGVTSIGSLAFEGCSSLTSIVIPESVTSIAYGTFEGCSSLTSIEIPNSVTSIGNYAFSGCSSLTSIVIPEGVASIEYSAFEYCSSLTSITCLATNPPALGSDAFNKVPGTIYVPAASVEAYKAADGWRDYASHIKAIDNSQESDDPIDEIIYFADDEVKAICAANWDTNNDGELSYEEAAAVSDIGNKFYAKTKIKSFDEFQYFTGLTAIDHSAFANCTSLSSIMIPDNIDTLDSEAFYGCTSLKSISLPEGVKWLGERVFAESGLESITIPNGAEGTLYDVFYGCEKLSSVFLPDCFRSLGTGTFAYCISLTSITLPAKFEALMQGVFSYCKNLKTITSLNPIPPIIDMHDPNFIEYEVDYLPILGFDVVPTIYVPASSVDAYKAAEGWSRYAYKIQAIP